MSKEEKLVKEFFNNVCKMPKNKEVIKAELERELQPAISHIFQQLRHDIAGINAGKK